VGWVWLRYPNEKIVIRRICRSSLSYRGYRILYILSRGSHWRAETGSEIPAPVSTSPSVHIDKTQTLMRILRRACEITYRHIHGDAEKIKELTKVMFEYTERIC